MKLDSYALAEATVLSLKMPLILMVFRKIICYKICVMSI